jgi:hypothetical protein
MPAFPEFLFINNVMKDILLCIVATTVSFISSAQKNNYVQFGIKGGLNLANQKNDGMAKTVNRTSFHAGGLAHIHLLKHFAVQPEILFSGQGSDKELSPGNHYETIFDYINIPVLAQYMYKSLRLQAGPQIGLLIGASTKGTDGRTEELIEYYKSLDISMSVGLSYLTKKRIALDARYNHGLNNVLIDPGVWDINIKNRVLQFGLFYQFKKKPFTYAQERKIN